MAEEKVKSLYTFHQYGVGTLEQILRGTFKQGFTTPFLSDAQYTLFMSNMYNSHGNQNLMGIYRRYIWRTGKSEVAEHVRKAFDWVYDHSVPLKNAEARRVVDYISRHPPMKISEGIHLELVQVAYDSSIDLDYLGSIRESLGNYSRIELSPILKINTESPFLKKVLDEIKKAVEVQEKGKKIRMSLIDPLVKNYSLLRDLSGLSNSESEMLGTIMLLQELMKKEE